MWKAPIYRSSYKKKYSSKCFLRPRNKTYPICKKGKIDCRGLRAASYYIKLNKVKNLTNKVLSLQKKYCQKLKKAYY